MRVPSSNREATGLFPQLEALSQRLWVFLPLRMVVLQQEEPHPQWAKKFKEVEEPLLLYPRGASSPDSLLLKSM